jgi:hypothetical protein
MSAQRLTSVPASASAPVPARQTQFRRIPLNQLHIPHFQRGVVEGLVQKIARKFDWDLFLAVIVYRDAGDGLYYVIDGQQRCTALRMLGDDTVAVPCLIYEDITYAEAARIFHDVGAPGSRKALTAGDLLKAELEAGDPQAWELHNAIADLGLVIDYNLSMGSETFNVIRAVAAVRQVQRKGGTAHLTRVLAILRDSFPDDRNTFAAWLLKGMDLFLGKYGARVTNEQIVRKLHSTTIPGLSKRADAWREAMAGVRATAVARAILTEVNTGRREGTRLPDWGAEG